MAIVAAIAALLSVSRWAWTLAPLWIAADVVLDRLDVRATVPVAVAIAVVVTGFLFTTRTGRGAARPGAVIAAALVPLAAEIQSPTDTEAALDPMAAAVAAVLVLAAVVGVLAVRTASARSGSARSGSARSGSARSGVAVAALAAVCGALIAWSRIDAPRAQPIPVLLGILLTAAVVALTATQRHAAQTVISALVYPVSAFVAVLFSVLVSIGGPVTALASNPPVHAGDEDAIATVGGLAAGLLVTWTVWVFERPAGALRAWFETFEQSMDRRFMS
jgi:hypothetical protein